MKPSLREDVASVLAIAAGGVVSAGLTAVLLLREPVEVVAVARLVETAPAAVTAVRESVPVVVAARDMDVGTTINAQDVKVVDWPGTALPVGFARSPDKVIGLGITHPIAMNEPLLRNKLAGGDLDASMTMLIPDGMRPITVAVNDLTAVGGFIKPGTRVDVMVTLNDLRNQVEPVTQVFLQNVPVLGIDRSISQQDANGEAVQMAFVTLLLSPVDAEKLTRASSNGRVQFAIRNNPPPR
jgi:pilus assembly protein CpaB